MKLRMKAAAGVLFSGRIGMEGGYVVLNGGEGSFVSSGMRAERSSVLAAIMSMVIPGLGQLYKGYFLWAVFWFVLVVGAGALFGWFPLVVIPFMLYVVCVVQAYAIPGKGS